MKLMTAMGAIAIAILASTAHAKEQNTITYNGTKVNQPYVGLKVGRLSDTFEKEGNFNFTGVGVYGGYNFDQHFGAEGEYFVTEKKAWAEGSSEKSQAQTYGAYGTFRYGFENTPFYAKAKAGVAKLEERHGDGEAVRRNGDTGFAYGLGAGYQTGNIGIEATFNRPHKEVDVVSLGASMAF